MCGLQIIPEEEEAAKESFKRIFWRMTLRKLLSKETMRKDLLLELIREKEPIHLKLQDSQNTKKRMRTSSQWTRNLNQPHTYLKDQILTFKLWFNQFTMQMINLKKIGILFKHLPSRIFLIRRLGNPKETKFLSRKQLMFRIIRKFTEPNKKFQRKRGLKIPFSSRENHYIIHRP
jgi:hypothetical protein